ncbi:GNAT family N-acetyltransferase [Algoriphagus pacificus]|uniref:GNAT family N-acetyltransferase n=1 Tax=Algoriphagus pacificus TaxID=2811234 RepID=A0ABS3CMA6_9BACT|nr:GNAT family N-acetyltransferase [Algoriphagus pacificus]MBN7818177.1 GNAT family N-acetyltransferase [Algoriphagus pacificus]
MVEICQAKSKSDLLGILVLQRENLVQNISIQEKEEQGFVRVQHSLELLESLNSIEPHIIAKEGETIAAYFLAMTKKSRNDVPMLVPMFDQFDELVFKGKKVSEYNYMAVGQVCIGKNYRSQGLFGRCYEAYKEAFNDRYDFAITEISISNARSLKAHQKVGFEVIHTFKDEFETWAIVVWDWA